MSSGPTHLLIGGVAGLALVRLAPAVVPPALAQLVGGNVVVRDLVVVALSAMLASWPDIDMPGSWIARRVGIAASLLGLVLGFLAGLRSDVPGVPLRGVALLAVASLVGLFVGALVGRLIPRGVQLAAGGHRGLTHSLLVGAILGVAGLALDRQGLPVLGVVPLALAWGLVCHVVGDVVTPAGIKPLLPVSDWTLRLPLGRFGEPIIALVAIVVGWVLIRG
jgi:membrane-bound metal-dependent hydrolase YbcI (DUF457 family)